MSNRWQNLLVQARPLHWAKNIIILVPLLTSQQFFNSTLWPSVLLVFAAFCLAASTGYQLNDLIDFESDRRHKQKSVRPLASGRLTKRAVVALGIVLAITSIVLALAVDVVIAAMIVGYISFSALYSAFLKRFVFVDVLSLAALYCVRVFVGATAIHVVVSPYLLAFCLFFFLSLAVMKRYVALASGDVINDSVRRTYGSRNSSLLLFSGVATALASSALFALYINDANVRVRYSSPDMLWGVWLALLYGVLRGWLAACRGRLNEDLINDATRDPMLWIVGLGVVVLFISAY